MKTYFFSWDFKTGTSLAVIYSLAQRLRSEVFFLFKDKSFDFDAFGFWRHLKRTEKVGEMVSTELLKLKEFIAQTKDLAEALPNSSKISFAESDLSDIREILHRQPDFIKMIWRYTSNDDLLLLTKS